MTAYIIMQWQQVTLNNITLLPHIGLLEMVAIIENNINDK